MTRLAREIATHVVADRALEELLRPLSRIQLKDSAWIEHDLGVYSQGGKGASLP